MLQTLCRRACVHPEARTLAAVIFAAAIFALLLPAAAAGEGVLREFGFATERASFYTDVLGLAVLACGACAATYILLELSGAAKAGLDKTRSRGSGPAGRQALRGTCLCMHAWAAGPSV